MEATDDVHLLKYSHGFSFKNRLGRALWKVVENTLFRWSPAPLFGWRNFLLRRFGARVARSARVYPSVKIWAPWNLVLDADACLSWGVDAYSVATIHLHRRALVSQHARVVTASHDIRDPSFALVASPIEIGAEAWVCAYAFVGRGVTVGQGAVVAATATVVKDVPAWAIVGGNPAKHIGVRQITPEAGAD